MTQRVRWFGTDVWRQPSAALILATACYVLLLLLGWLLVWADTPDSPSAPDPGGARQALAVANVVVPVLFFVMSWLVWRGRVVIQDDELVVVNNVRTFRAPLRSVVGADLGYWSTRFVTIDGRSLPSFAVNSRWQPGTRNGDRTRSIASQIVQRAAEIRGEPVEPDAVAHREAPGSRRRNFIMLGVCVAILAQVARWGPDEPSTGQMLIAVGVPAALGLAVEMLWPKPEVSGRRAIVNTVVGAALLGTAASVLSWTHG